MPIINACAEVIVKGHTTTGNVAIYNTFHYLCSLNFNNDVATLSASLQAFLLPDYFQCLNATYTHDVVQTTIVAGYGTGVQYLDVSALGVHGGTVGLVADFVTTYVVNRFGALAKRSNRGRVFLSPVDKGYFNADGSIIAPPISAPNLEIDMATDMAGSAGAVWTPVLVNALRTETVDIVRCSGGHRAGVRKHRRAA